MVLHEILHILWSYIPHVPLIHLPVRDQPFLDELP
jgi:hypothetical protein